MSLRCIVNKNYVSKSKDLKAAQKKARKYYQEGLFYRPKNVPKVKIRKFSDLNDVKYVNFADEKPECKETKKLTKEDLITLFENAKLTGRSGNGYLVSDKLKAVKNKNFTLIINGVECDPGLVTDSWLYKNKLKEVMAGAKILKDAFTIDRVILATKEPLKQISGIEQVKVADRFPLGYEKYLVKSILGINLRNDELPIHKGVLVMNLQTVMVVGEVVNNQNASQYKYITVANANEANAKVVRVKLGDKVGDVLSACYSKEAIKHNAVFAGGGALMCEFANLDDVVNEKTCYIALGKGIMYNDVSTCMRCGKCTTNCPAGVLVHKAIKVNNRKEALSYKVNNCIGCGACTYGCKAGIDVRSVVSWAKEGK